MKPIFTIRKSLKQIYTAKQCSDIDDVENALTSLRELYKSNDFIGSIAMNRRFNSLHKRKLELCKD